MRAIGGLALVVCFSLAAGTAAANHCHRSGTELENIGRELHKLEIEEASADLAKCLKWVRRGLTIFCSLEEAERLRHRLYVLLP